jgi:hypothetical protein
MRYTVAWTDQALSDLADYWLNAEDANALESASNRIDTFLAENPAARRCEVVSGYGTLIFGVLGVDFEIREPDRLVIVQAVWLTVEDE